MCWPYLRKLVPGLKWMSSSPRKEECEEHLWKWLNGYKEHPTSWKLLNGYKEQPTPVEVAQWLQGATHINWQSRLINHCTTRPESPGSSTETQGSGH